MGKTIRLKRGYNIPIKGTAEKILETHIRPKTYALKPTDFMGIRPIPKLMVEEGDEVKAGDPVFYDKDSPDILYTAPVSGEVAAINRGEKRAVKEVVILADNDIKYKEFKKADPSTLDRKEIVKQLMQSGLWPAVRQRPYGTIANPEDQPKAIFISGFNTAPLAPDNDFIVHGKEEVLQAGLNALAKLTEGKIHLGLNADEKPSDVLRNAKNVEINYFSGPHPAGNVGIQIHHIDPVRKGEVVWHVSLQHILTIGRLFKEGRYNPEKIITVSGPELIKSKYFQTLEGASIEPFIKDNLKQEHCRFISGDVLSGDRIEKNGHLGFYHDHFSVVKEGDQYEFMGWLFPHYERPSISRSFLSGWRRLLAPQSKKYEVNTNLHGERRPFVMTGQYEAVLPMKMYPQQLIKSILYTDFDEMEGLGIYEVVEEDLALCEFVCTSKVRVQQILREGLDLMREQG